MSVSTPISILATAPKSRAEWAARISFRYYKTLEDIFAIGDELIAAKAALDHGEFLKMTRRDLPFKERQAQRLMAIARNGTLRAERHRPLLPCSVTDLAALAGADEERLERALSEFVKPGSDATTILQTIAMLAFQTTPANATSTTHSPAPSFDSMPTQREPLPSGRTSAPCIIDAAKPEDPPDEKPAPDIRRLYGDGSCFDATVIGAQICSLFENFGKDDPRALPALDLIIARAQALRVAIANHHKTPND